MTAGSKAHLNTENRVKPLDPIVLRKDFPILQRTVHGDRSIVYLDNAATTQKPRVVIDALAHYYEHYNSNVHRALHTLAAEATEAYEGARDVVSRFINAPSREDIIFTRGTTESINLVAYAWGRSEIREGDEILLSEMEHHSNLVPWQILAKEKRATLKFIEMDKDGRLDLTDPSRYITAKTRLIAITQMSNVVGTVNSLIPLIKAAHDVGAVVLVDAAQSTPHRRIDVQKLDADFLVFSGHKMCGPTGFGVLYGRSSTLSDMRPFHGGGEMISKVTLEESTYAEVPNRFEAGTPNIAGAVGLVAAIRYLESVGMDRIQQHEESLTAYTLESLQRVSGLSIYGASKDRGGAISFSISGIHPHDLSQYVDQEGVAIRAGHMCCQPLLKKLGVSALSRASLYLYNTQEDVDRLVQALENAKEYFGYAD